MLYVCTYLDVSIGHNVHMQIFLINMKLYVKHINIRYVKEADEYFETIFNCHVRLTLIENSSQLKSTTAHPSTAMF